MFLMFFKIFYEHKIISDLYGRVTSLKNENMIILVSLGGWEESTSKYSVMMADAEIRAKFIASITDFVIQYNFDGLDCDIEYPGAYQVCNT